MVNLKRIIALIIVLVFSISIIGCGNKTVAQVNDEKITQDQLDKRMEKEKLVLEQQGASFNGQEGQMMLKALEQQTLQDMIDKLLLEQAAKKEKVYPDTKAITERVNEIIEKFGGEAEYKKALKQYSYTEKDIENSEAFKIAYTNLYEKVTADVKVSEDEMKKWYDENTERYKDPAKIGARAILIKFDDPNQTSAMGQPVPKVGRSEADAKKIAEDIIKELDKGTDFAGLAKEKSEDDRFKDDGGLVKDMAQTSPYAKGTVMVPEFDEAAIKLKAGEYTKEPVKTSQGYYVIKLESFTPEKQLSFEEAKDKIETELPMIKKQQKFGEYMEELRKNSKIVNKLAADAPQQPQMPPADPKK
ncbi:MAG: hypothetical protein CVU89_09265 [Firmicutes bacterium HGW-Firmicutes-14]|nr:MAG: hypothetical protein CVU89_09265 [Firmicutes bacterium HGW-Firmicutes-14]